MENITLGQIYNVIEFILVFGGSITTLLVGIKKILSKQLESLDKNQCKNYLVRFLADVEKGNQVDDVEIQRAYEVYDHYVKELKGNSYIHDKWERLMRGRD